MINAVIFGVAAFLSALVTVGGVRALARGSGWLAPLRADRWHTKPTALYGGVGIYLAFAGVTLVVLLSAPRPVPTIFWALFAGATGSFLLGLFDDIFHFKPTAKLIIQIAVTSLFIFSGGVFRFTPWHLVDLAFTYFWFLGIINAVNLIDNMDGLASGVVAISVLTLLVLLGVAGVPAAALEFTVGAVFLGAVAGFLFYNYNPASIFMGDSGSLFLGFVLAALAIPDVFSQFSGFARSSTMLSLILPVTVLAVPIFDTTLVTILRKLDGRSVAQGGRDHSSHRLVGLGFSERTSVNILYGLTATGGAIAVLMAMLPGASYVVFGLYAVFLLFVGIYLGRLRVYPEEDRPKSGWTPIVGEVLSKKVRLEILLDMVQVLIAYYAACQMFYHLYPDIAVVFFRRTVPVVILSTVVIFWRWGMFQGVWSLIAIEDIATALRAVLVAVVVTVILNSFAFRYPIYWQVYLVYGLLLFFMVVGSRLSFRIFDAITGTHRMKERPMKILLYGAGVGGKLVLDEIKRNTSYAEIRPVGFIDDDGAKKGRVLSGVRILGGIAEIPGLLREHRIEFKEIWIASRKIKPDRIRSLSEVLPHDVVVRQLELNFLPL